MIDDADQVVDGITGPVLSLPAATQEFAYDCTGDACIRRLVVGLVLILIAINLAHSPALADDASALIGRWLVPSREQEKSRMSTQCQQYAETDVQTVPESEIEIFSSRPRRHAYSNL
jgi:hypothetical protein